MEQLKIGICDDEKNVVLELDKRIQRIQEEWNCEWNIRQFHSGKELLKEVDDLDAVFLDIEMPEIDGIEVGRIIKRTNPLCKIIMATGITHRFKETFKINALRFITKPFQQSEIEEVMSALIEANFGREKLEVYHMRNAYMIYQYTIQYIEAYNGYSECTVSNHVFRKDVSLSELEKDLDNQLFFRISRKNIVNFQWISAYSDGKIEINKKKFKVSRSKRKEFEKKYVEYDLKYRWGFE